MPAVWWLLALQRRLLLQLLRRRLLNHLALWSCRGWLVWGV